MFTRYRTKALVLSEEERGEADRRITVFSEEFGLIEVVGKGLRKIGSKLRGGVLPFSVSALEFIQGRRFKILTFAETEKDFPSLKKNLPKLRVCYKMQNLVEGLVKEPQQDKGLWNFLVRGFEKLEEESFGGSELHLFYFYFAWRLLFLLGYGLELYRCASCGEELCSAEDFLFGEGGPLCSSCAERVRWKEPRMSRRCLKVLRQIERKPFSFVGRISVDRRDLLELDAALNFCVNNI